jgi:hypothetical protein
MISRKIRGRISPHSNSLGNVTVTGYSYMRWLAPRG